MARGGQPADIALVVVGTASAMSSRVSQFAAPKV
jgi:hypothetical protein